jgi:hypothetical protein
LFAVILLGGWAKEDRCLARWDHASGDLPPEVAPLRTAAVLEMSERTARSSVIRGPKAVSQQRRLMADSSR